MIMRLVQYDNNFSGRIKKEGCWPLIRLREWVYKEEHHHAALTRTIFRTFICVTLFQHTCLTFEALCMDYRREDLPCEACSFHR